jgi:hypothetical protein
MLVLLPATADGRGRSTSPLPIPAGAPSGAAVALQHVWLDTGSCANPLTLSASNALEVTIL